MTILRDQITRELHANPGSSIATIATRQNLSVQAVAVEIVAMDDLGLVTGTLNGWRLTEAGQAA